MTTEESKVECQAVFICIYVYLFVYCCGAPPAKKNIIGDVEIQS